MNCVYYLLEESMLSIVSIKTFNTMKNNISDTYIDVYIPATSFNDTDLK
jgi:hypothetical protein